VQFLFSLLRWLRCWFDFCIEYAFMTPKSTLRDDWHLANGNLVPLYQSETAPKWIRGTVGEQDASRSTQLILTIYSWCLSTCHHDRPFNSCCCRQRLQGPDRFWILSHPNCHPIRLGDHSRDRTHISARNTSLSHQDGPGRESRKVTSTPASTRRR
jgi:hypothetical protein